MLIASILPDELVKGGMGKQVLYCPELEQIQSSERKALFSQAAAAVLVIEDAIPDDILDAWLRAQHRHQPVILANLPNEELSRQCEARGITLKFLESQPYDCSPHLALLGMAEAEELQRQVAPLWQSLGIGDGQHRSCGNVVCIGAGIVNLLTAYSLTEAGFTVELMDAGPPPQEGRTQHSPGATRVGENARMFCFTEADTYHHKGDTTHANMQSVFERPIAEGGWRVRCAGTEKPEYIRWCERFHQIPSWRSQLYARDLYHFNQRSGLLWGMMRERYPNLFENVGFRQGIIRCYAEKTAFEAAIAQQRQLGALRQIFSPERLAIEHPALAPACLNGEIFGALEVVGFTLNIHDFVAVLIHHLEKCGVTFHWHSRVVKFQREGNVIVGLQLEDGSRRTADNYVVSPGAYGYELLAETRSASSLVGVAGLWMTLPNLEPALHRSMKIHREGDVGENSNVTLARDASNQDILILGSGYAAIGDQRQIDLNCPDIQALYAGLETTVRRFFPRQDALGQGDGRKQIIPRACIRPFTATGLGLFEALPAASGLALIAGGHNTGGFTQGPVVAEAVTATLKGEYHEMQLKYDPQRGIL